jgi:glycosyltransferase involved in cell wall biosynthesis
VADRPEISVIVGDFGRRRYVRAALDSLTSQTLPRARFEVVLIKNYADPVLDAEIAGSGGVVLFDEERQIGRWLRHAIAAAHAPLITFLDDDDQFEPERLERVLAVFAAHPDLGFYRNRVRVMDGEGRLVPPERWRVHETDGALDALGALYVPPERKAELLELATRRTSATFSTSSMALKRELLDGAVGDGFENTQLEDTYLFLAGVIAPYGVFLDDRRLTRYRFYGGNVSSRVDWLESAEASYRDMARVAAAHGRPDWAGWCAHETDHFGRMFRGGTIVERVRASADRREIARRTGAYLRFLAAHPAERAMSLDVWAAAGYGAGYLLAPPLARRVAEIRPTALRD